MHLINWSFGMSKGFLKIQPLLEEFMRSEALLPTAWKRLLFPRDYMKA